MNLLQMARGSQIAHMESGPFSMDLPRSRFLSFALTFGTQVYSTPIRVLNLPGVLPEKVVSDLLLAHTQNAIYEMPRAVRETYTLPAFALFFWWLVGASAEVMLFRTRLHWGFLLLGTLLCALWSVPAFGFAFFSTPADRSGLVYPVWSFFLWAALFAIAPIAWITQLLRAKHQTHIN
jgi:hypothetical protein